MDAAYRDGDGSIHLSFVPYHAGAGACCRSGAEEDRRCRTASYDLHDALPDFLPHRTQGIEATQVALVVAADPGRAVYIARTAGCLDYAHCSRRVRGTDHTHGVRDALSYHSDSYSSCGRDTQTRGRCAGTNDLYSSYKSPGCGACAVDCSFGPADYGSGFLGVVQPDNVKGVPAAYHSLPLCMAGTLSGSYSSRQTA